MHPIHSLILKQELVIFGDGNKEKDCRDIFETVDPFLSFRTLTTYIKHSVGEFANDECSLGDSSRLDSRAEYVLVIG